MPARAKSWTSKTSSAKRATSMAGAPKRVRWAPKARQDLLGIWRYFARVASPDIADNILRDIDRAAAGLADTALQWQARRSLAGPSLPAGAPLHGVLSTDQWRRRNRAGSARAPEFSRDLREGKTIAGRRRPAYEPNASEKVALTTPLAVLRCSGGWQSMESAGRANQDPQTSRAGAALIS